MADKTAWGITFKKGDGQTPTEGFAKVAPIYDVDIAAITRAAVDSTNHDSEEHYGEYTSGRREGGQFTVMLDVTGIDDTVVAAMLAELNDDDNHNYQLVGRDDAWTFQFNALSISVKPGTPLDDKIVVTVIYQISGKPVLS